MNRDDLRKMLAKYDRRYGKEELRSCWAMLTERQAIDGGLKEEPEELPAKAVRVRLRHDQADELARRWPGESQRRPAGT